MKRFITYLFSYDNGIKGKNVGFIRTNQRDGVNDLEIHVQGLGRYQGLGKVFVLIKSDELKAIPVGSIPMGQGKGMTRMNYIQPDFLDEESGEIAGISIRFGNQYYVASSWLDSIPEGFAEGKFVIIEENKAKQDIDLKPKEDRPQDIKSERVLLAAEKINLDQSNAIQEHEEKLSLNEEALLKAQNEESLEQCMKERMEDGMQKCMNKRMEEPSQESKEKCEQDNMENGKEDCMKSQMEYGIEKDKSECKKDCMKEQMEKKIVYMTKRIDLSDIRKLPKKNWYLCNNSFLIHGFFNYHYLLVVEKEEEHRKKMYLGVPGIYEKPERMMAMLFGFPDFKTEEYLTSKTETAEEEKNNPDGKFGYWLCLLDT